MIINVKEERILKVTAAHDHATPLIMKRMSWPDVCFLLFRWPHMTMITGFTITCHFLSRDFLMISSISQAMIHDPHLFSHLMPGGYMPRLEIMERVMLKVVTFHFYLIIDPQLVMSAFLLVDI